MKPGRRRLWLRILAALGLCAAGGLLLLAFAPLPVGWLVNRHGRDLPAVRLHVDSATLRLRPFGAGPTLDVRGLAVDQDGRPLARLARLDLFARKAELLDGRIAATIEAASLELTLRAADPEGKDADAGATPPDPPALLAEMRSWLAADPRAVSVSVRDIRVSASAGLLPSGVVAPDLARVDLVFGPRPEGELVARAEMHPADPRGPAPVIELVVAADNRSASASFDLPAVELGRMAALLTPDRPPETLGRLAARARADLDLVSLKPRAATLELDGDELRLASPSPFAFPPAALRLRLRTNEAFDQIVAERFELTAPDLEVALPGLEVGVSPGRDELRLRWGLRIAAAPARAWPAEWKSRVASLPPAAAALAAELAELKAEGSGATVLRRDSTGAGAWRVERAELSQTVSAQLGPTPFRLALDARQPDAAAPIKVVLRLPELNPAAGRAEGDLSPLAALDAVLSAEVALNFTPELKLADARLRFSAGPGRLRPVSELSALGRDLPFSRIELEATSPDGREVRLEKADFVADDSRISLAGSRATRRDDGRVSLDLKLAAAAPRLDAWAAWLPPETAEALKPLGWKTSDLGLPELKLTAQAVIEPSVAADATFDLAGSARVRIGEDSVPAEWTARREQTTGPVTFASRLPRLAPGVWPGRPTPDFAWSDLRLPLSVEAEGRLEPPAFAPHVRVKARAGAGSVVLPASVVPGGEVISLRDFSAEAAVAGDPLKIEVPELRLRLDEAVELSVTAARVDLHGNPKTEGRWAVSPLDLADALAAWPAKIEPELRTRVAEHLKGGRVERLTGEFAMESPPGSASKIGKAEVDMALADVSVAGSLLPVPMKLRRAEGTLRWPRVAVRVEGMDLPGLAVSSADVNLADMTASSWTMATRADYVAELAALPAEWGLPKGVAGRVTGSIAADAKLRPEAGLPEELTFSGRVAVAALEVPGAVGGEATGRFGGGLSGDRGVKLEGVADASRLDWRAPELAGLRAPAELRVKAAAKLDTEWRPVSANVAFSAPDVLGQAFALRLVGEWTKGPSAFPAKVDLAELAWGRSRISGEFVETAQGPRVNLRSPLIVVPEIVTAARPRLASMLQPGVSAPLENPQANGSTPSALASLVADVKIERIELGEDRVLRDIELAWSCGEDGLPRSASLSATEGAGNRLLATLETKPQERDRRLALRVDDVPRWAAAASAPLRVAPPAPTAKLGELEAVAGVMLGNLDTIVGLLAGGSLEASAVLPENQKPPRLQAVVAIRNATVLRAPRIVQMLALKSGRELQTRPLLREFSIQGLSLRDGLIEVAGVKLDGTGLIDKLRINKGSYALDGEVIAVDGTYFGIGFEVDGTRRDPQVWLKDNLLIRAVGNESNLDFGE